MSDKKTQERVYEEQIKPLLGQLKDICHEHEIPWVSTFQVEGEDAAMDVLTCMGGEHTHRNSLTRGVYAAAMALHSDEMSTDDLLTILAANSVLGRIFGEGRKKGVEA